MHVERARSNAMVHGQVSIPEIYRQQLTRFCCDNLPSPNNRTLLLDRKSDSQQCAEAVRESLICEKHADTPRARSYRDRMKCRLTRTHRQAPIR